MFKQLIVGKPSQSVTDCIFTVDKGELVYDLALNNTRSMKKC